MTSTRRSHSPSRLDERDIAPPPASDAIAMDAITIDAIIIDIAPLDRLAGLLREQARLDGFRVQVESRKDQVDDVVYRRVLDDYAARHAALEEQAAPLKTHIRREYDKLRSMHGHAETTHADARHALQEVDLRLAVGEIDADEAAARRQPHHDMLERLRTELSSLDAIKARFIESLGSEEALDAIVSTGHTIPVDPTGFDAGASSGTHETPAPPEPRTAETNIFAPPDTWSGVVPASSDDSGADPSDTLDEAPHTLLVPMAVLVEQQEDGASTAHHLGWSTSIGRAEDSHICIRRSSVSRQHAIVAATANGFVVQDLHSQNGTFINGERVSRRTLTDGDRVTIGDVECLFQVGKPNTSPFTGGSTGAGRTGV